ncbi:MAG: 4-hydroxybenzoate solanesyltransferase [Chlamydiae bacterium]|nr:4-hydroxybenzoate solanesyltransferase [Chlamydiota bacterium]
MLLVIRRLLQLEQSLLALPWVLTAALLAVPSVAFLPVYLIVKMCLATMFARSAGMAFNRFFDKDTDLQNPRTKHRLIPSGQLSWQVVLIFGLFSLALFITTCFLINALVFFLSFVVAFLLVIYPLCKRFTTGCHFVLGLIEFFAPIMAFAAVTHTVRFEAIILGLIVFLWISGLDLLYAIQDIIFDRVFSIYSLSASMGARKVRRLAFCLHLGVLFGMVFLGYLMQLHSLYFIGVFLSMYFLFSQYRFIRATAERLPKTFFVRNIAMSMIFFFFTLAERMLWNG